MKYLLDTHIWLWGVEEPERLSAAVRQAITAADAEIWLSPASIWELDLLVRKGKYRTTLTLDEWVRRFSALLAWRDAPITSEVALKNARMGMAHKDPADRWLVATARTYGLTLVTADAALIALKPCALLANRLRRQRSR